MAKNPLSECVGFERDDGNLAKNWERHRVTPEEAEDVFFHDPFVLPGDSKHSREEMRYRALGQTSAGRRLFLAFVVGGRQIRVISVRDMNLRESEEYGRHEERDSVL